jgi:hypothetical protein
VTTAGLGGDVRQTIEDVDRRDWLDLGHLLVQFWESSSIRPKFVCLRRVKGERDARYWVGCWRLLPEIMKRGIIDLVEK